MSRCRVCAVAANKRLVKLGHTMNPPRHIGLLSLTIALLVTPNDSKTNSGTEFILSSAKCPQPASHSEQVHTIGAGINLKSVFFFLPKLASPPPPPPHPPLYELSRTSIRRRRSRAGSSNTEPVLGRVIYGIKPLEEGLSIDEVKARAGIGSSISDDEVDGAGVSADGAANGSIKTEISA